MDAEFPELVPGAGLEPARLAAGDFESPESTNFTTRAVFVKTQIMAYFFAIPDGVLQKSKLPARTHRPLKSPEAQVPSNSCAASRSARGFGLGLGFGL